MAKEVKVTKAQVLAAIAAVVTDFDDLEVAVEVDGVQVTYADIRNYVDTTATQLATKAAKAKEKAAEKKEAGDELLAAVEQVLTDEFQTLDEIFAQIEGEDITKAKVTARLTKLVKADRAHKTDVKVDGKVKKAYAAGPAPEEDAEEE